MAEGATWLLQARISPATVIPVVLDDPDLALLVRLDGE